MEFEKNDCLENEIAAVRTQCTMIQARLYQIMKIKRLQLIYVINKKNTLINIVLIYLNIRVVKELSSMN